MNRASQIEDTGYLPAPQERHGRTLEYDLRLVGAIPWLRSPAFRKIVDCEIMLSPPVGRALPDFFRPAQGAMDTQEQFSKVIGLAQAIVCAQFQRGNTVGFLGG
jgi:hypothetical protein